MAPGHYAAFLRRHALVVGVCVLLGAVLGWGVQSWSGTAYEATAAVLVKPTGAEDTELVNGRTSGEINLDTEAQLVKSAVVAAAAASRLGPDVDPVELAESVAVTVPPNTAVLRIGFTAATPARARAGADAFADAYLANRRTTARRQINGLTRRLSRRVDAVGEQLTALDRRASLGNGMAQAERDMLLEQLASLNENLNANAATPSAVGRVINPAQTPTGPSGLPPFVFPLSGGLCGLLLGIGVGMLRERRVGTVRSADDLEVAGVLPLGETAVSGNGERLSVDSSHAPDLRKMQARVRGKLGDRWVVVVAGVSTGSSGGYLAANLAASLARSGADVLFVDANAESSPSAMVPGSNHGPGLAELLQHECRDAGTTHEVGPASELRFVHPGAHSGLLSDLLHGQTLAHQVDRWRRSYRYVVIEVAPAAVESDLEAVAPLADGVVLVAEAGRTRPDELADAADRLAGVNAHLLGVSLLRSVRSRGRHVAGRVELGPPRSYPASSAFADGAGSDCEHVSPASSESVSAVGSDR